MKKNTDSNQRKSMIWWHKNGML